MAIGFSSIWLTIVGGGHISSEDIPTLKEAGIEEVFLPGAPLKEIISWVQQNVKSAK